MILTTTSCKALLNISTSITTYDTLISDYISFVQSDIIEISGHNWHDAGHWFYDSYLSFSSSNGTITLNSNSTINLNNEFQIGNTIDIQNSYHNSGLYTISSIASSHIMSIKENLINENSTDFAITTYLYRCYFPLYLQKIAAKMVWFNVQNTTSVNGDIVSESLGGYSVSYRNYNTKGFGLYPANLIAGIKRKAGSY